MPNHKNISILIKRANLKFDKVANRILSNYEMTSTQLKILKYLFHFSDFTVTQRELEIYFSMTNPTVTGILQNLQKKGFIIRKPNPKDARSKVIGLADKSRELKGKMYVIGQQLDEQLTKNLNDEERILLMDLLEKIVEE
ncbi:MAG: MarR family transcriptional regulator [Streptococcus sp.]|nr:MarR family transcriptional regulator [Streptococcus sp.]